MKVLLVCFKSSIKGRLMGLLVALVYRCFRENVITCKIVSFLCNVDNFLLKNVIVFTFRYQILKWRSFDKKKAFFDLLFAFLVTREKTQNSFNIFLNYKNRCILLTLLTCFLPYQFSKITNLFWVVSLWCKLWGWFLFAPFWSNQWIAKWYAKFKLEHLLLTFIYTNAKFTAICKFADIEWWWLFSLM